MMNPFKRFWSILLAGLLVLGLTAAMAAEWPQKTISAAAFPVEKNGSYTQMEEVAVYLATYGKLPGNYITKNDAEALGWDNRSGNLWKVAPGKSIGGSYFGNYEGALPKGKWTECDVNFDGGYRGSERILFSKDGLIYYTNDHYNTFTQLCVSFEKEQKSEKKAADKQNKTKRIVLTKDQMDALNEYGEYSNETEVAAYLHVFGQLPCNYITMNEAKELGWKSKKDNLAEVMPGCSIGGDEYDNKKEDLPTKKNRTWYECDVNTVDGKRGKERLLYSDDGLIYYSPDKYKTFIPVEW